MIEKNKKIKGFTIIELIIVMAVFLFIIGAAISLFISIIQNQKKVLAEQQFLNQISYIEEYMSKALRMAKTADNSDCIPSGYVYQLTDRDVSGVYRGIKFFNQTDNKCQKFYLEGGVLKEIKGADAVITELTPSNLKFYQTNPIRFSLNGGDGSVSGQNCIGDPDSCGFVAGISSIQPRVTVLLNVLIPASGNKTSCTSDINCPLGYGCADGSCQSIQRIQTTVSRRNLNAQQ